MERIRITDETIRRVGEIRDILNRVVESRVSHPNPEVIMFLENQYTERMAAPYGKYPPYSEEDYQNIFKEQEFIIRVLAVREGMTPGFIIQEAMRQADELASLDGVLPELLDLTSMGFVINDNDRYFDLTPEVREQFK